MLEQLLALDVALFAYVNRSLSNAALDFLMPLVSNLGSVWVWVPLGVLMLAYRKSLGRRFVFGLVAANAAVLFLKGLFARPRPDLVLQNINVLDTEPFASFPSAHAANAFLAAYLLSQEFPKYKWVFYSLAVLVGFSRMYVGVHYPLDVLAGAALGIGAGYAVVRLLPEKRGKSKRTVNNK